VADPLGGLPRRADVLHDGVAVIALSFGALRYRWEVPDAGVVGGGDAVVTTLRDLIGAKPMVQALRGARRRR